MSASRPETEKEWEQLAAVLAKCKPETRSELFLILDMDVRRGLIERSAQQQKSEPK